MNSSAQAVRGATTKIPSPLSNSAVKAAPVGATLRDTEVPGLHVRVFNGGLACYYLHFRTKHGIERRPKIGQHGILTLADARRIAREMLVAVAAGGDPVADRDKAKAAPNLAELGKRYMAEYGKTKKTGREDQRMLDRIILPALGTKRVPDVEFEDVQALHARMSSTPYQANRVLSLLHRLFALAERPWKIRPLHSNPCEGVKRYTERARRRYANPAELAALGPLLEREAAKNPRAVAFVYLLMFSGARPSEIERATWPQLERVERGGSLAGVLRLPDAKTGPRDVYLPPQAMVAVDRLSRVEGATITGIKVPRRLWGRVRKAIGAPDLWARDFRRLFATVSLSNGVSAGMVGELLGQKSAATTKRYALLMEDPAHVAAADTATRLEHLLTGV